MTVKANSAKQEANFQVPYQCEVVPVAVIMNPIGGDAIGAGISWFNQNSDTDYSLTEITIVSPWGINPPELSSEIVMYENGGQVPLMGKARGLAKRGKAFQGAASQGRRVGLQRKQAETTIRVTTSESTFRAGSYQAIATLSCSQAL